MMNKIIQKAVIFILLANIEGQGNINAVRRKPRTPQKKIKAAVELAKKIFSQIGESNAYKKKHFRIALTSRSHGQDNIVSYRL